MRAGSPTPSLTTTNSSFEAQPSRTWDEIGPKRRLYWPGGGGREPARFRRPERKRGQSLRPPPRQIQLRAWRTETDSSCGDAFGGVLERSREYRSSNVALLTGDNLPSPWEASAAAAWKLGTEIRGHFPVAVVPDREDHPNDPARTAHAHSNGRRLFPPIVGLPIDRSHEGGPPKFD